MTKRLLTVAIQTYNRSAKVDRLVRCLAEFIAKESLHEVVEVLVSDNASTDDTEHRLCNLRLEETVRLRYIRQSTNLEFDGNTAFLYDACETPYMWLFGDDDIPFEGSLTRIATALRSTQPDLLLFSFAQPPDSVVRQFNFPDAVQVVTNRKLQAELVVRYTKISIFVFRVVRLDAACKAMLSPYFFNPGWYYVGLAYTILAMSDHPRLTVISEPLAGSEKDWMKVAYAPWPYLNLAKAVDHPFVRRHSMKLIAKLRRGGYRTAVSWCLQAKLGGLEPERPEDYDKFFRSELAFRPWNLLGSPRTAWAYFLVWSGLWRLLPRTIRNR
jgi:glycosyltransferase involved in cell wall biosynthesis